MPIDNSAKFYCDDTQSVEFDISNKAALYSDFDTIVLYDKTTEQIFCFSRTVKRGKVKYIKFKPVSNLTVGVLKELLDYKLGKKS